MTLVYQLLTFLISAIVASSFFVLKEQKKSVANICTTVNFKTDTESEIWCIACIDSNQSIGSLNKLDTFIWTSRWGEYWRESRWNSNMCLWGPWRRQWWSKCNPKSSSWQTCCRQTGTGGRPEGRCPRSWRRRRRPTRTWFCQNRGWCKPTPQWTHWCTPYQWQWG